VRLKSIYRLQSPFIKFFWGNPKFVFCARPPFIRVSLDFTKEPLSLSPRILYEKAQMQPPWNNHNGGRGGGGREQNTARKLNSVTSSASLLLGRRIFHPKIAVVRINHARNIFHENEILLLSTIWGERKCFRSLIFYKFRLGGLITRTVFGLINARSRQARGDLLTTTIESRCWEKEVWRRYSPQGLFARISRNRAKGQQI